MLRDKLYEQVPRRAGDFDYVTSGKKLLTKFILLDVFHILHGSENLNFMPMEVDVIFFVGFKESLC